MLHIDKCLAIFSVRLQALNPTISNPYAYTLFNDEMAAPPTLPVVDPSTHAVKPQSRKSTELPLPSVTASNNLSVEDFREGYPRFTSLISSHDPFFLFRRFGRLRARLLLIKQDKLAVLDITFMWHG